MALTAITELEAINTMLHTIGESPINSLTDAANVVDAVTAKAVLREITVAVQEPGWHFNIEKNFVCPPTATGEIIVPPNAVSVTASGPDASLDLAMRGQRLYDRTHHTYTFEKSITVDMILLLPFDELPQAVRYYIAIRAARVFQQRVVGSDTLGGFTEKDEARARADLRKFEADTSKYNILNGSYSVARTLNR